MGIIHGPAAREEPTMLANLIDQVNQQWKLPLLHQMFDEVAVEEITTIPIRSTYAKDLLVWTATTDGN